MNTVLLQCYNRDTVARASLAIALYLSIVGTGYSGHQRFSLPVGQMVGTGGNTIIKKILLLFNKIIQ